MSSNEWEKFKLSEIMEIIGGGTPRTNIVEYWNGNIPWLSVVDFGGEKKYVFETEKSITQLGLDNSSAKILKKGQIIISARGTVGELAILGKDMAFNQSCYGLNSKAMTSNDFLYYLLKYNIEQIKRKTHGAVFDTITRETFDHIEINLPPISTQRRIADILSALDDKIELNRQTNATLEAIAQAIFKEWFVDFNFPGATGELVESELGMIPKGWMVDTILAVADLLSGGTPSTKITEYWNGDIKWISAKDVSNSSGTFILDTERNITRLGVKNSSTKILPKLTTIVTARGTVGSYCILSEPMAMNQTNYGLKAKEQESDYFVFFSLANLVAQLKQASYGTIFDTVTTTTFEKSKIIIPPFFIIQKFDRLVKPIMETILGNIEQSKSLSKIRDSILPKLMNGEINFSN
jgi:type I restriction enzyme S subunit